MFCCKLRLKKVQNASEPLEQELGPVLQDIMSQKYKNKKITML